MTTVLVATERELEFNVLSQTLADQGYSLVRTKDGVEALDAIRTHQPAVLLANVVLPKLDGFSLYRRCQQDEQLRRVPIVLFSTRSNDQKSERFAADMGITHFVGNALKSGQLGAAIEAARAISPEPLPAAPLAPRPVKVAVAEHKPNAIPDAKPDTKSDSKPETKADSAAHPQTRTASINGTDVGRSGNEEVAANAKPDGKDSNAAASVTSEKTVYLPGIRNLNVDRAEVERQEWLAEQTSQRDALRAAQAEAEQLRARSELFQISPVPMWILDKPSQCMLDVNDAALMLFGYKRAEFLRLGADALLNGAEAPGATQVKTFRGKDGRPLSLMLTVRDLIHDGHQAELYAALDVSYRVRGERALAEEVRRQRVLLNAVPLPYLLLNGANRVLDSNELCLRKFGYRRDQILEADFRSLLVSADPAALEQSVAQGTEFQARFKLANGEEWAADVIVSKVDMGGEVRMLTMRDQPPAPAPVVVKEESTSRKLPAVLEMLRYAEDADEATLLQYAMAQLAQAFDSPLAMFCAMERVTQTLEILAIKQAPALRSAPELRATIRSPAPWSGLFNQAGVQTLQVTDESMLINGLPEISSFAACSTQGGGRDAPGHPVWLLVLANREREFSEVEQHELRECADVLAALLARKRMQYKIQAAQQRQAANVEGMLTLVERLIDTQDVYAAGSGRRIAALAGAIAKQLKLSDERIAALVAASRVHDIGQLLLPRELFLLPRALNLAERTLVKSHIEQGARLLRSVDFGMDVSGIVVQHHERLDGSGYPGALKADQISMEARILAVADVVDAMTTARAHRPAQELSAALGELRSGSGTRYDSAVVSVCEKIFADLNGQWPVG